MNKTEIKKELYKQKPEARLLGVREEENEKYFVYITSVEDKKLSTDSIWYSHAVLFHVPEKEMFNDEGEIVLNEEEPAQLLIRWLI